MLPEFRRTPGFVGPVSQLQDATEEALRPVLRCPLLDGRLVLGVTLEAGKVHLIPHGLGRAHRGYLIVDATAVVSVASPRNPEMSSALLPLLSHADAIVSVWVF